MTGLSHQRRGCRQWWWWGTRDRKEARAAVGGQVRGKGDGSGAAETGTSGLWTCCEARTDRTCWLMGRDTGVKTSTRLWDRGQWVSRFPVSRISRRARETDCGALPGPVHPWHRWEGQVQTPDREQLTDQAAGGYSRSRLITYLLGEPGSQGVT